MVAGGVGANAPLRAHLLREAQALQAEVYFPPLEFCTDNGAMIAFAAALRARAGLLPDNLKKASFTVRPRWDLHEASSV